MNVVPFELFVDQNTNNPTGETYNSLDAAFSHFNVTLFNGRLEPVLLTVRNHGKAYGYFAFRKFQSADGGVAHEIAINPRYVLTSSIDDVLSTVVHEMCHEWQYLHGTPSRNGYHNQEFARKMKSIGLHPSSTGEPGGAETGQRMSHFIVEGGPFDRVTKELLARGFELRYGDRPDNPFKKTKQVRYVCPGCGFGATAKAGHDLICGECRELMPPKLKTT